MISILLPAYKSNELLKKVFCPSFMDYGNGAELLVYDNGGNEQLNHGGVDYSYGRIAALGDGRNIGLHAAYNKCFKLAKGDWFYLPHTDQYLLPNWDTELLNATRGMVASKILLCSRSVEPMKGHTEHHRILDFGKQVNEFNEVALIDWYKTQYQDTQESQRIEVGARMPFFLHRSLLDKMADFNQKNGICDGPFDDHYFSYGQDDDIIQTCFHLGVRRFHMAWGSLVYHLGGQSNKQQNVDRGSDEPYKYFVDKWKKWYPDIDHPARYHSKNIPFGTTVK
ncbi:MAG: glycosyltransferase [Candidatus Parcubacteria bacterium]|nr:glycosyltransferase [Candidatus Parcubacteria bacterium]